ncbi:MAG: Flp family type IVb pilin [Caulobacterales bacterium]|jgi:pilus assembly protein Flp/PilA|nr:Flp family type IVb pilin [Caulobacterales bacterium]
MIKLFLRDERGTTAIEYGLIAALIGIGLIAGLTAMSDPLNEIYEMFATEVSNAIN